MQDITRLVESVTREVLENASAPKVKTHMPLTAMTLETAKALIAAVMVKAREMGVKAVCAVTDAGGNLVALERMDDAFIASIDIAINKAFTVVSLKMPTKDLATLAAPGGSLYGIQFTNGGKIVIFGGGEPLIASAKVIGGFGVSGGTAEEDTALGEYARSYFETHLA